ncbi:MAG: (2Fe-2S)-binding protein [Candidatus Bruticola sp.]
MSEKNFRLQCTVNGHPIDKMVDPSARLLDTLRNELHLTGVKEGCGKGECGACTIFMDGKPVDSCLVMTIQAQGHRIVTIEGLAFEGRLDSIQQMFVEEASVQCGFCIPGMVLAARALIEENPNPSLDEIRHALGGNICRCTGYHKIFRAVMRAAAIERELRQSGQPSGLKDIEGIHPSPSADIDD